MKKTAVIFGGTGFVGRNIVKLLAAQGITIKVAARVPESAYFLKPLGDVGQIAPVYCNTSEYDDIANTIQGADYVINCVGILFEKGSQSFEAIHESLAESIAAAAAVSGVKKLVHISALGVDQSTSEYAASKLAGEKKVLKAFPNATILRPSIIFGQDDDFFNRFAKMAQILPALPLIGGGHTRFQPVFVGDVAQAVSNALNQNDSAGQTYELGGPDVLTFKEVYEKLFEYTQNRRCLVNLPFEIAKIQASLLSLLPTPILTQDQVESLKTDNVVGSDAQTLSDLRINPTNLDQILPDYLIKYRAGGRFAA